MKAVKVVGFTASFIFAAVGLAFLLVPEGVLAFFNDLSGFFGLPQSSVQVAGFYLALAAAYMYLVTVLAFLIAWHPEEKWFPFLLAHGKLASSAISMLMFVADSPYLIYIANGLVDGLIGLAALRYYLKIRRKA